MFFVKMQGLGNDFIVIEDMEEKVNLNSNQIIQICDRHFGIGADGLMLIRPSYIYDVKMIFYNQDGTEAAMCGNGIRCFAKYVYDRGIVKGKDFNIETIAGKISPRIIKEDNNKEMIQVNMGKADYNPLNILVNINKDKVIDESLFINGEEVIFSSVSVGVPHTVVEVNDLNHYPIKEVGALIEKHFLFPNKTNVNFVKVLNSKEVKVITWERGAGLTLACGTGACAVASILRKKKKIEDEVKVQVPGGLLEISIVGEYIFMTGPAEEVFTGEIDIGTIS